MVPSDTPFHWYNGPHEKQINHPKNPITGHVNVSSIRTDIFLFSETKIDY